jgi:D-alanyl-D-alanine dipeptidase
LVDLRVRVPSLQFDIRYATADNATGEPLPGDGSPGAWATAAMADALAEVQAQVEADGGSLLVYDAYRPVRGTEAMVTWTKTTGQEHLITDGYIAARSGHNKGNTVDLTVSYDSHIVDMGTPWDTFSTDSHTRNATGDVLKRRLSLQKRMVDAGFRPYSKEWWHFSFPQKGLKAFDVPYGCSEEPACD